MTAVAQMLVLVVLATNGGCHHSWKSEAVPSEHRRAGRVPCRSQIPGTWEEGKLGYDMDGKRW